MSTKRKILSLSGGIVKKQRKAIDLETKMKIIQDYEAGKTVKKIACDLKLAHSTVSTILKDKVRVKEAAKSSTGFKAIITRQRKGLVHEMEKLLAIWFDFQMQNNIPLSVLIIQTKARSIFEALKARKGENSTESFTASYGWFQRFRRRFNLHNWKISGGAASVDVVSAENFVEELNELIKKGNFCPEQIFNVAETRLKWKKMLERSYEQEESKVIPDCKAYVDKITLLLGGNAAGFKLKPFVIYHSKNPRALKNISKNNLPVYFRASKRARMTQPLFEDWFLNCFIPSVQQYCLEKSVPFKIILLLDNGPGHPQHLDDLHPDVKVLYFPKNTTAILQPMDQGAVAAFKEFYLHTTFSQAVKATENNVVTLKSFWRSYSILDCINNIKSSWDQVTDKCMQGMWEKCIKSFANIESFNNLEQTDVLRAIAGLANTLNLDAEMEDIAALVYYDDKDLTNDDLIELEALQHLEEEEEEEEEEKTKEVQKTFTLQGLASVFCKINEAMLELEAMDSDTERFNKVEREIDELLKCYREIYDEKKNITKQTTHKNSLSKVTSRTSALNDVTCTSLSSSSPGPSKAPDN